MLSQEADTTVYHLLDEIISLETASVTFFWCKALWEDRVCSLDCETSAYVPNLFFLLNNS